MLRPMLRSGGALAGPAAIYLISTIVNAAIPFLLLPLLTRWLGPADFGVVALFMALVTVIAVPIGLGTHGLVNVVYYRDGPQAMPPQAGAALGVAMAMMVFALALCWLGQAPIERATGILAAWQWTIIAAAGGQFAISVCLAIHQAQRRPVRFAMVQIGYSLVLAALTIAFVGGASMAWEGRALAQALAAGLIALLSVAALSAAGSISWAVRDWPVRAALAFGLPLMPHAFGAVAMASIDRFALGSVVGATAVGQYFVAAQIASILTVLAAALNQAWLPWLYARLKQADESSRREVVRMTLATFLLLGIGATVLALAAPLIVPLVAGPGFEPAIDLLRLLAPASAFAGAYFFVSAFLFYEKRTGLLSVITAAAAVFQLLMSLLLVRAGGAAGVALATLLTQALYSTTIWIAARRVHPMSWGLAAEPRPVDP